MSDNITTNNSNIVKKILTADSSNTLSSNINVENSENNINKLVVSYNNGNNIIEKEILPVNPRTIGHQQYLLYVPIATAGGHAGISSYDDSDFIVSQNGKVSLSLNKRKLLSEISRIDLRIDTETDRAIKAEQNLDKRITDEIKQLHIDNETDPTVPTHVKEIKLEDIESWNNKYVKPTTGIPKEDLTDAVQASLLLADNANSYTNEALKNYYTKLETNTLIETAEKNNKNYTDTKLAALIGAAPETLDTFEEIAAAFAEDQNVLDTLNTAIGLKVNKVELDNYYTKTASDALLFNKVDKVTGKTLSTNDFTDTYKIKLDGLENYDDTALKNSIPTKVSQLDNDSLYVTETELTNKGYETIVNVDSKVASTLNSAKSYTDTKVGNLIGAAPETLDTIYEVAKAIQDNVTVVDALNAAIGTKANQSSLDTTNSNLSALTIRVTNVETKNTEQDTSISNLQTNKVDKTTTVNGKPLSSNVTLSASDVGALPSSTQIPTVNNGTLTIQKNGTNVAIFSANQSGNATANIVVPTQASDVNALPNTTKYGASLSLSINNTTYVVTAQLKDQNGNNLGTAQTIDLPLESVVVSGSYDKTTKEVILTLKDGSTIKFSVADLVSGLASQSDLDITNNNVSSLSIEINNVKNSLSGKLDKTGGTLTGPLKVTGGDSATAGKLILDESNKGQITNSMTGTLFGFTNTTDLTVGHGNYNLVSRGKATRPKYNGNDLALYSDTSNKQPTLVSGTNIKTINGESLLGSGNIEVAASSDADSAVTLPVGSIFASAIPLTDAAFHLLDGSVISQTGIYADFSNLLKSLVTAGYTISCTLTEYNTDISNTGNCGKFVIDDTAGTIKLPTITRFIEGLSSLTDIGKSLQAGLPNITGNTTGNTWNAVGFGSWTSGAFQISNIGQDATEHFNPTWAAGETRRPTNVNLNASRSSAVYGRSSEVQPKATRYPYYIVLANSYKSKVALDVDNVMQEVNSKYQQLNSALNGKQATLVSGSNIKTVGGESLVGSGNIKIMEHWYYSTNMPETAAADSEQWIYAEPGTVKIVYYNFNATTNDKSLIVKDNDTSQRIAYMANKNGYNQYHLATIVVPSGKCYYFKTTIAAQYSVVTLYV